MYDSVMGMIGGVVGCGMVLENRKSGGIGVEFVWSGQNFLAFKYFRNLFIYYLSAVTPIFLQVI